jgi:hypothetical protein
VCAHTYINAETFLGIVKKITRIYIKKKDFYTKKYIIHYINSFLMQRHTHRTGKPGINLFFKITKMYKKKVYYFFIGLTTPLRPPTRTGLRFTTHRY